MTMDKAYAAPRPSSHAGKARKRKPILTNHMVPRTKTEIASLSPLVLQSGCVQLSKLSIPQNIHFREMQLRDVAAVFHLGEEVFNSDSFPQLYRTWDAYEVTEHLATDSELCIIAEAPDQSSIAVDSASGREKSVGGQNGKIVGFALGSITEKRKSDQSCALLGWVAVSPAWQRRNVGTFLVHKLFSVFHEEKISLVIADTPRENDPALRFLGRMGFGCPVDHVYMSLNLTKAKEVKRSQSRPIPGGHQLAPEVRAIKIREMTIDDLSPVHDLGERIYDVTLFPNLYRIWSESEVVELYGSDNQYCQVAELNDKMVGFVMGTTIEKPRSSWKYGYLIWLGIDPEVQRYGVGRKLFSAFLELMLAAGCRIIMIDTQADNLPARSFFERQGFASLEQHVYFSKVLRPEDIIAEAETLKSQPSLTPLSFSCSMHLDQPKASPIAKATRLMRFKTGHAQALKDATAKEGAKDSVPRRKSCRATIDASQTQPKRRRRSR